MLNCDSYNNYDPHADTGPGLAASGNGAGFKMGNTFTGVRHVVRNCVSIKNKAQGFYANHSHGGSDWFNNTAYANRGAAVRAHRRADAEIAPDGFMEIQSA